MKTSGNTILVTGGGSGIGQALAWRWHDSGNQVIVAGRRKDALAETIAGRHGMAALEVDITDPAAIEFFAAEAIAHFPKLNVLVNNAGMMSSETLTAPRDLASSEATVMTNLLGPIRLINALTAQLASRSDAAIINVTSGLAFVPLISAPTYSATKAALHSYTVSLRQQWQGKIEVIELAPPGVQTHLTPGQATREGYMSLADFTDEAMRLLEAQPTPAEICVQRASWLRSAEAEGRFDAALTAVNPR
jgi:uncharacterized oxidoreductase